MDERNCKHLGFIGMFVGLLGLVFAFVYTNMSFLVGVIGLSVCLGMLFGSFLMFLSLFKVKGCEKV